MIGTSCSCDNDSMEHYYDIIKNEYKSLFLFVGELEVDKAIMNFHMAGTICMDTFLQCDIGGH
ncbi:hypothetical protein [Sporanaerobacter acetigenes]|uniref:hypothetical protein n=1 Tax=Sporanaerobacter acetigenes TaxID=165813 RepID=UPI001F3357DF|nr:hypothetical protein [Sporanaerobacter acetigenes]